MNDLENTTYPNAKREPWNKGKLIGQKPSLQPKHVWQFAQSCNLKAENEI